MRLKLVYFGGLVAQTAGLDWTRGGGGRPLLHARHTAGPADAGGMTEGQYRRWADRLIAVIAGYLRG